jgi:hypothetical protein
LADQAPTFAGVSVGTAIGARVGWPPARLQGLLDERDALLSVAGEAIDGNPREQAPFGCGAARQLQVANGNRARLGERGAARAALQAGGQSVAEAAAAYRATHAGPAGGPLANGLATAPATAAAGLTVPAPAGEAATR